MRSLPLIGLLACLATLFAPLVRAAEPMAPSATAEAVMSGDPADFYESAASANQFEMEAGRLALDRSQDADVKAYAQRMIKDHGEAAQKLTNLATGKNVELLTQLLKRHQMMLDGLKEQEDGAAFDEDYRRKMVSSHTEAVSLFDRSAKESPDPDIRKFALDLLPTLQKHADEAHRLQAAADEGTKKKK